MDRSEAEKYLKLAEQDAYSKFPRNKLMNRYS